MSEVNLKNYSLQAAVTTAQAHDILTSKSSACPQIKTVSVRPDDNVPVINGNWYHYNIEVKNEHVKVKPKFDRFRQMIFTLFCIPSAIWLVQGTFANLDAFLLPLGALFLSFGIVFTIWYLLGIKEQNKILPFIYTALTEKTVDRISNPKMAAALFSTIVSILVGIAAIAAHFLMG